MVKFPIKVRHKVYRSYVYTVVGETTQHWITDLPRGGAHDGYLLKQWFEIANG
jgi:hypothetical protein